MTFVQRIQSAKGKRLLIGGHRGHLSSKRENTIENFEEVALAGVEYIEIDVQLSKDQQAVIYHDIDLSERSPLKGFVHDYTVEELKASFELCTLDEAVCWCKEHHMYMLLEVKSRESECYLDRPVLAQEIAACLTKHCFCEQCIVFSVDHRILKMVKHLVPKVNLALIVPHIPHNPVELVRDMDAIIYLSFLENLSRPLIDELHDAGIIVDGSVVNTPERLEKALAMGVDMIESDYPEEIIKLYQKKIEETKSCSAM